MVRQARFDLHTNAQCLVNNQDDSLRHIQFAARPNRHPEHVPEEHHVVRNRSPKTPVPVFVFTVLLLLFCNQSGNAQLFDLASTPVPLPDISVQNLQPHNMCRTRVQRRDKKAKRRVQGQGSDIRETTSSQGRPWSPKPSSNASNKPSIAQQPNPARLP